MKNAFIQVSSLRQWAAVLENFYAIDGPGVWPSVTAVDEVNGDLQSCEAA